MGGSLCMDLKAQQLCREVRGVARRTQTVLDAFFADAVDFATNDPQTGILGADIVILATPVRTIVGTLEEIGPRLWPGTLVMDMGSTKPTSAPPWPALPAGSSPSAAIPCAARRRPALKQPSAASIAMPPGCSRPCSAPPEHWTWPPNWRSAVGARPVVLEPDRHDRLVASISHLPFLLASALTGAVAEVGAIDPLVWELAAGGFRDTSRVAASDTQMFLDILLTNRAAVLAQVDAFAASWANYVPCWPRKTSRPCARSCPPPNASVQHGKRSVNSERFQEAFH